MSLQQQILINFDQFRPILTNSNSWNCSKFSLKLVRTGLAKIGIKYLIYLYVQNSQFYKQLILTNSNQFQFQFQPIPTNSNSNSYQFRPIPSQELELELVGIGIG